MAVFDSWFLGSANVDAHLVLLGLVWFVDNVPRKFSVPRCSRSVLSVYYNSL